MVGTSWLTTIISMVRDISPEESYEPDELDSVEDVDPTYLPERLNTRMDVESVTLPDLNKKIHEVKIDLNPPYQRDPVWPHQKQSMLINSLFHHYWVPPIVLAEVMEDGELIWRVVDGKQRLTSVQNFFAGIIPFKHPVLNKSYWYSGGDSNGPRLKLPEKLKDQFDELSMLCVVYKDLTSTQEREIFQRVQLGMPLTSAEKIQAADSPIASWIALLSKKSLTSEEGLSTKISVDLKRGRDFQSLAQLVYCCDGLPERRNPTPQKLQEWIVQHEEPSQDFKNAINDVLSTFWYLADEPKYNKAFVKFEQRVAPVEFVFIGVLLYTLRGCTYEDQARCVYEIRRDVRTEFRDVRMNPSVIKHLWNFIATTADEFETGVYVNETRDRTTKAKARKKRMRYDDDDEKVVVKSEKSPKKVKRRSDTRA